MLKVTLGDKTYPLPYITARAMRSIGPMEKLWKKVNENMKPTGEDMDAAIDWLCLLFNHQFTPDEVLDHYPMTAFWQDIFIMFLCVQNEFEDKLMAFPTNPAQKTAENA